MASPDILKEQLSVAHREYQALKVELGELQKKWDLSLEKHIATRRGQEAFEFERVGLETEMAMLKDREKHVQQMMNQWLTVIEECIKAIREVVIHC